MLNAIKSLAYAGASGQPSEIVRRTVLVNASGLSAAGVTLTYQVFYLVWGLADYPWVVGVNTVALLVYMSLPSLNRADRHDLACNLLTAVACIQLFVVDLLLGIGTQLFYFVFIGFLPFMYTARSCRRWRCSVRGYWGCSWLRISRSRAGSRASRCRNRW